MEANGLALDLQPLVAFTVHQTAALLLRPAWERTDPAAVLNVTQIFPGLTCLCQNSFAVVGFAWYKITLPCNWVNTCFAVWSENGRQSSSFLKLHRSHKMLAEVMIPAFKSITCTL